MVHCSQGFAMRIILQWHWIMKSRRSAEFYVGNVLSRINGIEFNGFILYGVDQYLLEHEMKQPVYGLLEFNHIWHENEKQREYLFLGESNISWYVYQYKNQCYMELDQPSGREIHRFRNFYEMFDKVLDEAIKG